MRRNIIFAQLMIFGVISVSIIAYTLFGVIGIDPTASPMTVTMRLKLGGGVFEGSEVAYRGVEVGKVDSVDLKRDGVTVTLSINEGTKIPVDSIAHVYDLSVVGEQYVDLVPRRTSGPVLRDGDVIPVERTTTPISTPTVLLDVERLVKSIDPADIRTVSTELAAAFAGSGPQLRQILDSGGTLVRQLTQSKTAMVDLLHNGRIVLDTAARRSQDFKTFADSLQTLTATLKSSTPTIEKLIEQGPSTTRLVDQIVRENGSAAAVLMGNLVTFGGIQVANIPGLKALLVAVPEFGRLLPKVVRNGAIQAGALFNYNQQVCATGVPQTSPLSSTRSPIYQAACGNHSLLPRGAANAPPPVSSSARTTSSGATQVGTYDPAGGLIRTQNGATVRLGSTGGQDQIFGTEAWQTLLLPVGSPR
ncbi:MAG: MCE family protein [Actinomycetota bacterium]|nr:MCE family protein [Actinomycetota bacterium]